MNEKISCLKKAKNSGLSMIELIAIIAILGILASIAIPRMSEFFNIFQK